MKRARLINVLCSAALAVAALLCIDALQDGFGTSTVQASSQNDSKLSTAPGFRGNLGDPPTFLNAGSQRGEQLVLMREVLVELKAIRTLLRDGGARVNVDSVDLDYERLSNAVIREEPAASGSGSAMIERNGGVRRVSQVGADERTND